MSFTTRIFLVAVIAGSLAISSGCSADPREVFQRAKELEPAAEKRNREIRELTGVPDEQSK